MSQSHRDYQKTALYRWEDEFVNPRVKRMIKIEDAQAFVDGIFLCEKLLFPPKVVLIRKNVKALGRANREKIELQPFNKTWVVIHELAHSITMEVDSNIEGHGADFVGVYIKLLDKYCDFPLALSMFTLSKTTVKYNLGAQPRFKVAA